MIANTWELNIPLSRVPVEKVLNGTGTWMHFVNPRLFELIYESR